MKRKLKTFNIQWDKVNNPITKGRNRRIERNGIIAKIQMLNFVILWQDMNLKNLGCLHSVTLFVVVALIASPWGQPNSLHTTFLYWSTFLAFPIFFGLLYTFNFTVIASHNAFSEAHCLASQAFLKPGGILPDSTTLGFCMFLKPKPCVLCQGVFPDGAVARLYYFWDVGVQSLNCWFVETQTWETNSIQSCLSETWKSLSPLNTKQSPPSSCNLLRPLFLLSCCKMLDFLLVAFLIAEFF